jgi:hypothetical protein
VGYPACLFRWLLKTVKTAMRRPCSVLGTGSLPARRKPGRQIAIICQLRAMPFLKLNQTNQVVE